MNEKYQGWKSFLFKIIEISESLRNGDIKDF